MSNKDKVKDAAESKEGIDIEKVTFDENGEVVGLDDTVLEDISGGVEGGVEDTEVNIGCPVTNNTNCS